MRANSQSILLLNSLSTLFSTLQSAREIEREIEREIVREIARGFIPYKGLFIKGTSHNPVEEETLSLTLKVFHSHAFTSS